MDKSPERRNSPDELKHLGIGMMTDNEIASGAFLQSLPHTPEEHRKVIELSYGRFILRAKELQRDSEKSAKRYKIIDKLTATLIIMLGAFISFLSQVGDCVNWWAVGFGCTISLLEGFRNLLGIGGKGVKFKAISIKARKLTNAGTDLLENSLETEQLRAMLVDLNASLDELEITDFRTGEAKDIKYAASSPEVKFRARTSEA